MATVTVEEAHNILEEHKRKLFKDIKNGAHAQFVYNVDNERVQCKCGHAAVWWKTNFVCGTITARPCEFTRKKD